jgi:hypothetical protein
MLPVATVYVGLITIFTGAITTLKPLSFLAIHTRWQALIVVFAGLVIVLIGASLPAAEVRITSPQSELDQFMPVYQFDEFHSVHIAASKETVYRSIREVTAGEIRFYSTLTWMRRFGKSSPEGILNLPENARILDMATRTSFIILADDPNQEIVLGTLVIAPPGWRPTSERTPERFQAVNQPGFALAAMNFRIEDDGPGTCTLTTETRVYATDAATRRAFARYWRVIYPGSALIRRMWLHAIAKRAEAAAVKS